MFRRIDNIYLLDSIEAMRMLRHYYKEYGETYKVFSKSCPLCNIHRDEKKACKKCPWMIMTGDTCHETFETVSAIERVVELNQWIKAYKKEARRRDIYKLKENITYTVRGWEDMVDEFGPNSDNYVFCDKRFIPAMRVLCGKKIEVNEHGGYYSTRGYFISCDMLEEFCDER